MKMHHETCALVLYSVAFAACDCGSTDEAAPEPQWLRELEALPIVVNRASPDAAAAGARSQIIEWLVRRLARNA